MIRQFGDLSPQQKASVRRLLEASGHAMLAKDLVDAGHVVGYTVIALDGDEAIGLLEGRTRERWWNGDEQPGHQSPFAKVENLVVAEEHRRQGIGRCLFAAFVSAAIDDGCTWLELQKHWTDDGGRRAAFFRSLGLSPDDARAENRIWGAAISDLTHGVSEGEAPD